MGNTFGSSPAKQCVPETWSTSSTEGDTVAHSFQVAGFSLLDGMGAGNLVSSSTFRVGDCDWDITFYPESQMGGRWTEVPTLLPSCVCRSVQRRARVADQLHPEFIGQGRPSVWAYLQIHRYLLGV